MLGTFERTILCRIHTKPEKFKNGGFTLKTREMFSIRTTPEKFENTTIIITGHFGFVVFTKCFPSTLKRKAGVFKFLRFREVNKLTSGGSRGGEPP